MIVHQQLLLAGLLVVVAGCGQRPPPLAAAKPKDEQAAIEKLPAKHLPNPVRLHAKIISGGLPEGDEAFAELQGLGIKTVISVDGAKPDVARAEKFGLRYVHLPHGYDGVPAQRGMELAKAVRDLEGPIYLHCHHGKHRSPAAAAVACVGAGLISPADAPLVLQVAGTSANYRGLFESANNARRLEKGLLDRLKTDFPAVAKLPATAEAMVEIEHTHDHLKALEKASWKKVPNQPALEPAHEALLLREHFTEMLRTKETAARPAAFQRLVQEAEAAAQVLEDAIRQQLAASKRPEAAVLSAALKTVSANCTQCHREFRDVPLGQKGKN